MIASVAFGDEFNNHDCNRGDQDHVNVAALVQDKLKDEPKGHQYRKSTPHPVTFLPIPEI